MRHLPSHLHRDRQRPLPRQRARRGSDVPGRARGVGLLGHTAVVAAGLAILVGLAVSSLAASSAASHRSAQQHLGDQRNVVRGAAQSLAPPASPTETAAMGKALATMVGVSPRSSAATLTRAMSGLAALSNGGAAAVYDPASGRLLAHSPLWTAALARAVTSATFAQVAHGSMASSNVVRTGRGPYLLTVLPVTGWGSAAPRAVVLGGLLDGSKVKPAAQFVRSGVLLLVDGTGVVVSSTDEARIGTRVPWWRDDLGTAPGGVRDRRLDLAGVDTQVILARVPGTSQTLAMVDPASDFYRAARSGSDRIKFSIILTAALAGVLLILGTHRRAQLSRRGAARLAALLEDTGDAVLVVEHTTVTFAFGGWPGLPEVIGRPVTEVFGGVLCDCLNLDGGAGPQGRKRRFDTAITLAQGPARWVQVTVAERTGDRSVRGLVITLHDVTERREMQRRLHYEATHDQLTGLINRGHFNTLTHEALTGDASRDEASEQARPAGELTVVYLDLDAFKPVNDRFGHDAGDVVLRVVSDRLRAAVRSNDVVARLGGDEFAVLVRNATADELDGVIERIRRSVALPITLPCGDVVSVGVSVGAADAAERDDVESLLRAADASMYEAKAAASRPAAAPIPAMRSAEPERRPVGTPPG